MTAPPLLDLPPPARLKADPPSLVPPEEVMLETARSVRAALWRRSWKIALVTWFLWGFLLLNFVVGTAPTVIIFTTLFGWIEPGYVSTMLRTLGFSLPSLLVSSVVVPLLGTAMSLALIPVAARWAARINPQRHLTEVGFQRAVTTRIITVLLSPVAVVTAIQLAITVLPLSSPWKQLGSGPLAAIGFGLLAVLAAEAAMRPLLKAADLLGIPTVEAVRRHTLQTQNPELRHAAMLRLHAQDRRHLPPPPRCLRPSPRGILAGVLAILSRSRIAVMLLAGVSMWLVFGLHDAVVSFTRIDAMGGPVAVRTGFGWPFWVLGTLLLLAVLLVAGLAPYGAAWIHRGKLPLVTDQRTYVHWAQRRSVNPWEGAIPGTVGIIVGLAFAAAALLLQAVLALIGSGGGVLVVWTVLAMLVYAPILGSLARIAMQERLRDVFYGPAGDFMRRTVPWALIAPGSGTRAERDANPAVQALRRERSATGRSAALLPGDPPRHQSPALREMGLLSADGLLDSEPPPDLRGQPAEPQADAPPEGLPDLGVQGGSVHAPPPPRPSHDIPSDLSDLGR